MHAHVAYADAPHGARHRPSLVYPHDAYAAHGRISAPAPLDSALPGPGIDWQAPGAPPLRMTAPGHDDDSAPATR